MAPSPRTVPDTLKRPRRLAAVILSCAGLAMFSCARSGEPAPSEPLTIFAAASTTDVITELADMYRRERGTAARCSFDASSALARQIHAGAPADVYLSANPEWMNDVERAGLIQPGSRMDLLANRLVLVMPNDQSRDVQMTRGTAFADALPGVKRVAMGDPLHVPAGRYARESLEWLGWWDEAQRLIIPALDVRSALRLVELGEADAGIVYATDAAASARVRLAGIFPAESHSPIRYPIAIGKDAHNDAAKFLTFLRSPAAADVFRRHGFEVIAVASDSP